MIDDPGLADRVTGVRMAPQTYDTAEDLATQKRMATQVGSLSAAGKAASPAQPTRASRDQERDNSVSSNSKKETSHPNSKKRQWIAPSASDEVAQSSPRQAAKPASTTTSSMPAAGRIRPGGGAEERK